MNPATAETVGVEVVVAGRQAVEHKCARRFDMRHVALPLRVHQRYQLRSPRAPQRLRMARRRSSRAGPRLSLQQRRVRRRRQHAFR